MPTITAATSSVASTRASTSAAQVDFKHFSPTNIATRSDGSVALTGMLNRSVNADVRLTKDGAVMLDSHLWNKAGVEHPASKAELKQLKANLTRFLSTARLTPNAGKAYTKLMAGLDAALKTPVSTGPKKVTQITTQRLLQSTNHALQGSNLGWHGQLPLGVQYVEVPLFKEKHPDGFSFSAMVPVGALAPNAKLKDPNLASTFIIKRTGGFAGGTTYSKPVNVVR